MKKVDKVRYISTRILVFNTTEDKIVWHIENLIWRQTAIQVRARIQDLIDFTLKQGFK